MKKAPSPPTLARLYQQRKITHWTRMYSVALCVAAGIVIVAALNLWTVSRKPAFAAQPERINPNTAPLASLVRLPGIGKARALDILHYRDDKAKTQPAFQTPQDMENIRGIGPKTVQNIQPYLTFEQK